MGLKDKAENTGEKLKGKAKETEGRATGDKTRENQGKARPEQVGPQAGRRERQGRLQEVGA